MNQQKIAMAGALLLCMPVFSANAELGKSAHHHKDAQKQTVGQAAQLQMPSVKKKQTYQYAPGGGVAAEREFAPSQPAVKVVTENAFTYIAGTPVVTSPYLGQRTMWDASDLIVRISTINLDLRLLEQRQRLQNAMKQRNEVLPDNTLISLSGKLEVGGSFENPYNDTGTTDFNVLSSEIITVAQVNSWVTGYASLAFDNSPSEITGRRMTNSRVYLNKGFLTIGNLNQSPVYFTGGQLFVPFGRYNSYMLSAPVTQVLGRVRNRVGEIGFKQNGIFGAGYVFKSDTGPGDHATSGANLGYAFNTGSIKGEMSAGFISNIADAEGVQGTISGGFGGFGTTPATEDIINRIPALNIQGSIGSGPYTLVGEFVSTTEQFNAQDLQFNGEGASPLALNLELARTFKLADLPASVGIGYGYTNEALALGLPKQRISAVFNYVPWRDVIFGLEFRHDINYKVGTTAGGRGISGCAPTENSCFVPLDTDGTLGHTSQTITAQIGYYF